MIVHFAYSYTLEDSDHYSKTSWVNVNSVSLAITIASTSCATVNDLVTNTCSTLRADSLCVIFIADFLRFSLNHCNETRMEIFLMTSKSRAMMYFAGKKLCQCVSH